MAIRKVARLGHPVLRISARALSEEEIRSAAVRTLIDDMKDTMAEYGGIGLAAPQVHESVRLAILELRADNPRYDIAKAQPLLILFNPRVTVLDATEQSFWEGCLSVPDLRGLVPRPRKIQVDYLDEEAKPQRLVAEDFLATVFQHELDHLDGVVYLDKIRDRTKISFLDEYRKYWFESEADAEE